MTAPTLADLVAQIQEIPAGTPERYDVMAFLFITLARAQWRMADSVRASQRRREVQVQRRAQRTAEGACVGCGRMFSLRVDGKVRRHQYDRRNRLEACPGGGQPPVGVTV